MVKFNWGNSRPVDSSSGMLTGRTNVAPVQLLLTLGPSFAVLTDALAAAKTTDLECKFFGMKATGTPEEVMSVTSEGGRITKVAIDTEHGNKVQVEFTNVKFQISYTGSYGMYETELDVTPTRD